MASNNPELWTCPKCKRKFRQINQRHSCGVGDKSLFLRNRPENLIQLYEKMEKAVLDLRGVEIVYRDRYALFRTSRIFADLVMMKDTLRLAIHLKRVVKEPLFFKVVKDARGHVSHVVKIRIKQELQTVLPYLAEAHQVSIENK